MLEKIERKYILGECSTHSHWMASPVETARHSTTNNPLHTGSGDVIFDT